MKVSRKEFLLGVGGAAVGLPLGAYAHDRATPGNRSFSQCGEDLIVDFILGYLGVQDVTYLDIGAFDPIKINNTYFFYLRGFNGVLVEPNPVMCEKLRSVRPGDVTLTAGIGIEDVREADFYQMSDPSWNTFSKEEADHQVAITKGKIFIEKVLKMPLLDINRVMAEHFGGAPTYLSIDAEGMHFDLLKAIDYQRFRPVVICVETLVSGTTDTIPEIAEFMVSRGYVERGGSFVNGIFVDSRIIAMANG
jgi:hypothetical protein